MKEKKHEILLIGSENFMFSFAFKNRSFELLQYHSLGNKKIHQNAKNQEK